MAHSEIPAEKIAAYRGTGYRLGQGLGAITLRIDTRSEALLRLYASSGHNCGVFITAQNPLGEAQSAEANDASHARLAAELKALQIEAIEGAGADPGGAWPAEKSLFALGVDLDAARRLGVRYRQNAIVWVGEDVIPKLILLR